MALIISLAVVVWAFLAPDQVNTVGVNLQSWVVSHLGWLFTLAILGATIFMLVIGYGPTGSIRLGADDTRPEFSTFSWVSMLFAAGLGIDLIFYGPMEPLIHFQTLPPAFTGTDAEAGTVSAADPAVAQSRAFCTRRPSRGWSIPLWAARLRTPLFDEDAYR